MLLFDANNNKKQAKWQLSDFQTEHFQLFPKSVIFFRKMDSCGLAGVLSSMPTLLICRHYSSENAGIDKITIA